MIALPEKFKAYRPQVEKRRHDVAMAKNKVERTEALLKASREALSEFNAATGGRISAEIVATRSAYQKRINALTTQLQADREAVNDAWGVDDVINESLPLMGIN